MATFNERVQARMDAYRRDYKIDELNQSNDLALLYMLIRSELLLEDLQNKMELILSDEDDLIQAASELKKMSDLIRDLTGQITTIQKTLNIDRKSRKSNELNDVDDYIRHLKKMASDFIEQRLIRMYCPTCKVLVGRIGPAHEHTAFTVSIQCSQCNGMVRAQRNDKDVFFDVRNADWRREQRAEIKQPERQSFQPEEYTSDVTNEVVLDVPQPPRLESDAPVEAEFLSEGRYLGGNNEA